MSLSAGGMRDHVANNNDNTGELHTEVFRLDTPDMRWKWQRFVDDASGRIREYEHEKGITWRDEDRKFKWDGLSYAGLNDDRVDPHVAIVSLKPIDAKFSLWYDNVVAFVPYSVIRDPKNNILVLPMGLTKLPSYLRRDPYGHVPQQVRHVFRHLMSAIAAKHGRISVMTRFASNKHLGTSMPEGANAFSENHMFGEWSKQFPGKMRLDWIRYAGSELTLDGRLQRRWERKLETLERAVKKAKDRGDADQLAAAKRALSDHEDAEDELTETMQDVVREHDAWPKGKPDTYDPGQGGALYDHGTFIIRDHDGNEIFKLEDADKNPALPQFFDKKFCIPLGCIVSAWTH